MKSKLKKWDIIQIFWLDSMSTSGWKFEDNIDELTKDKYLLHTSVGFFVKKEKYQIVIVQSKSADGEEKSNVAELLAIPIVCIKKIKKL